MPILKKDLIMVKTLVLLRPKYVDRINSGISLMLALEILHPHPNFHYFV